MISMTSVPRRSSSGCSDPCHIDHVDVQSIFDNRSSAQRQGELSNSPPARGSPVPSTVTASRPLPGVGRNSAREHFRGSQFFEGTT